MIPRRGATGTLTCAARVAASSKGGESLTATILRPPQVIDVEEGTLNNVVEFADGTAAFIVDSTAEARETKAAAAAWGGAKHRPLHSVAARRFST